MPEPLVFIVDDDDVYGAMVRGIVRGLGARAVTSTAATGVLDAIVEAKPQIVLLDVYMPGLDGPSLCQMLRARPELEGVQLLLCSALALEDFAEVAQQCGADDCFTKTDGVMRARQALLRALERRQLAH